MNTSMFMAETSANENFINRVKDLYLNKINLPSSFCTRTGVRTFIINIPMLGVNEKFKVMYPSKKDKKNNIRDGRGLIFSHKLVLEHGIDNHTHYVFVDKDYNVYDYLGSEIDSICMKANATDYEKTIHFDLDVNHII